MITRGSALGGTQPLAIRQAAPLGAHSIFSFLHLAGIVEPQSLAGGAVETGTSPLGEIIAMRQRRDYADAVPQPAGRAEVWQQDGTDLTFEISTFLGNAALLRCRSGGGWYWRPRAGLTRLPASPAN
jgi:hypothetical protein